MTKQERIVEGTRGVEEWLEMHLMINIHQTLQSWRLFCLTTVTSTLYTVLALGLATHCECVCDNYKQGTQMYARILEAKTTVAEPQEE